MKIYVICPQCHQKMIYQGGNVTVFFSDDEIGERQEVEIHRCEKCKLNTMSFGLKIETDPYENQ